MDRVTDNEASDFYVLGGFYGDKICNSASLEPLSPE